MTFEIAITPRSEREAIISKSLKGSTRTHRLDDYRGTPTDLKVVRLPINLPIYRMRNGRTVSAQKDMIATKELALDHFIKGQESSSVQRDQHQILEKITKNAKASVANIEDVLIKDGQSEPLLMSATGVVINGNRRLSVMRNLYAEDPVKYSNFKHIDFFVLPPEASADDFDDIEATLQARPQTKLDYDWVGDAHLVRRQVEKGRSFKVVAEQLRRKPTEIKNLLQALEEADLYLSNWAFRPGQYSLVSDDGEQIFKDIPKYITSHDPNMQNASRAIAWSIFENPDKFAGRIYQYNAAFGKLAPQIIKQVTEELKITLENPNAEDEDFDFIIEEGEQELDFSPFIEALKKEETKETAIDTLADACVEAIERAKGKKKKDAALKALSQVHSKLKGIDVSTAGKPTYEPMQKQVKAISIILEKIDVEIEKALKAN